MLAAFVEIVLAAGDVTAADEAATELGHIAETIDAPLLHASAAQARGAVPGSGSPRAPRPPPTPSRSGIA